MRNGLILVLIILLASFASISHLFADEFSLKYEDRKNNSFIFPEVQTAEISLAENLLRGLSMKAESRRIPDGTWSIIEGIFPLAGGLYIVDWAERNDEEDVKKLGYLTVGLGAFEILSGIRTLMFKSTQLKKYENVLAIENSTAYSRRAREDAAAIALKDLARKAKIGRLVAGTFLSGFALYWIVNQPFQGDPYSQYNYFAAGMWGLFGLLAFFTKTDEEMAYKHYLTNRESKGYIKVYGGILPREGFYIKIKYSF